MAVFVIGDLHLSLSSEKPMDVFYGWEGYLPRLEANWRREIAPEDTVVVAGDISWAMKLEDTAADFAFLQSLPGRKLLLKGNHDYWWTTMRKMETFLKDNGFDSLHFLHNCAYEVEGLALCGTRSWLFDVGEPEDRKVMDREVGRLKASLADAPAELERVAFLHYPPVYAGVSAPEIVQVLHEYGVRRCYYGHLHGNAIRMARQGNIDGIDYRLVSADGLGFCPCRVTPPVET